MCEDSDDCERPFEEWEGYLGQSWDRQFVAGPELRPLAQFDWDTYQELAPTDARELTVHLVSGTKVIKFDVYSDIVELLYEVPSVDVTQDSGPADAGPASGSGYVICLAAGASLDAVRADISALVAVLEADLSSFQHVERTVPKVPASSGYRAGCTSYYKAPKLDGHKVAFKGKRFWVIEIDEDHPFEGVTSEVGEYAIYDKLVGVTIATCLRLPRGKIRCEYSYGQISLTCDVDEIENVGRVVFAELNKLIRDCS